MPSFYNTSNLFNIKDKIKNNCLRLSLLLQFVCLSRSLEDSEVNFDKRLSEYTLRERKTGLYTCTVHVFTRKNLIGMRITRVLIYNMLVEMVTASVV